jgi:hypothetical protein
MINEILRGFVRTALQDLQYSENDEACTDEREPRTIETLGDGVEDNLRDYVATWFARAEPYLLPSGYSLTHDLFEIGSDLYLTAVGHGAGFWDGRGKINRSDGEIISDLAPRIEIYAGDDGKAYVC